jgi:hypothetical protein
MRSIRTPTECCSVNAIVAAIIVSIVIHAVCVRISEGFWVCNDCFKPKFRKGIYVQFQPITIVTSVKIINIFVFLTSMNYMAYEDRFR